MSDDLKQKLADIAARFDAQIARMDDLVGQTRPPAHDRRPAPTAASTSRSLLERLRSSSATSRWEAVTQRTSELERFRRVLLRNATQARRNADEWERCAALAVKAGDDDLAREALHRRREHLHETAELDARAKQLADVLNELQASLDEIKRTMPAHRGPD